ncbi:MAG: hypothetical protein ACI9IP_001277 [Arcticibacterium sp.]|jgi:hypothetical protein
MTNKWTDLPELPAFFDRYILKVDDLPLSVAFEQYSPTAIMADLDKIDKLGDQVYAPGKWTIKDILQHIIDTERIMSYRALCFARNDKTELPGFAENNYADNTNLYHRTLEELMEEWQLLRASTRALFAGFSDEMLLRKGTASNIEVPVLALGFMLIGHAVHHYQVIEERYFPILD